MHIKFLGTGGAFEPHKGTSAAIVTHNGKNILIDCGYTTFQTLKEKNLASGIDYILITHLHADHVGSLPTYLAFVEIKCEKQVPILYPSESFRKDLLTLFSLSGEVHRAHFVKIEEIEGIGYIDTKNQHKVGMQSYAYYFTNTESLLYYSGDLANAETTRSFLDTRNESHIEVFHDIGLIDNSVHVHYKKAQELLSGYSVYGYHCDIEQKPEDCTITLVEENKNLLY
jgi:glyoxylase-like metal-dependent hydrolase (beta-lactamase superfamily II)